MDDTTKRYREHVPVAQCEVYRVDAENAVCTTSSHDCDQATPYGNYCEHVQVYHLGEFIMPGAASFPCPHRHPPEE